MQLSIFANPCFGRALLPFFAEKLSCLNDSFYILAKYIRDVKQKIKKL